MNNMESKIVDRLWGDLQWRNQKYARPDHMFHVEHWWMLIYELFELFDWRVQDYLPFKWIFVDQWISRWYGLDGGWVNIGLPKYLEINQKPENGCRIQNLARGGSGLIMCLLTVNIGAIIIFKNLAMIKL